MLKRFEGIIGLVLVLAPFVGIVIVIMDYSSTNLLLLLILFVVWRGFLNELTEG